MKLKLKYKREMKMNFNDREKIVELTPLWKGERLPDGRPKVEDKYLDALYGMTLEEVWKPIFVLGYWRGTMASVLPSGANTFRSVSS